MGVVYWRGGGRRPPPDNEQLRIDDQGAFTLWRSIGAATYPPTPIGRFAGSLDAARMAALEREVAAARAAGNLVHDPPPGAAIEHIDIGGVEGSLGSNDEVAEPWGALVAHLRALLGALTAMPRAALALEVARDGMGARLAHLGDEPLRLDLRALTLQAVLWQDADPVGKWSAPRGHESGVVTATPGWSLDLPFDHGFAVSEGAVVRAYITCTAYDGDLAVPVSLTSA